MKKIITIFNRNWDGDKKVVDAPAIDLRILEKSIATEKLDGMNVRVTIRSGIAVRLEKRRNPSKEQKALGIAEPWYKDADEGDSGDKHLFNALENTGVSNMPDGEWSGEAVGVNIQGNTLNLINNRIVFFSRSIIGDVPIFYNVPTNYEELRKWLPLQKSRYGNDCGIEGIVWHCDNGDMYKIKVKDFKY